MVKFVKKGVSIYNMDVVININDEVVKIVEGGDKTGEIELNSDKNIFTVFSPKNWNYKSCDLEVNDGDVIEIRVNPIITILNILFAIFLIGGRFLAIKYSHQYPDYKTNINIFHIACCVVLLLIMFIIRRKVDFISIKKIN